MNHSDFIIFHYCFHTFITTENNFLSIPKSNREKESAGILSVGQTTLNHSGEQKFITVLSHQPWIFSAEMIKAKLSPFLSFFFFLLLYLQSIHSKERNFKAAKFRVIQKMYCAPQGSRALVCKEMWELFQPHLDPTDISRFWGCETPKGNLHNSGIFFKVLNWLHEEVNVKRGSELSRGAEGHWLPFSQWF